MRIDARVPVVFGALADAGPEDAVLIDGDAAAPDGVTVVRLSDWAGAHGGGCLCCLPRSAAGSALAALFLARGRGEVPWFRRVVAVTDDKAALLGVLENDMLASGWFRAA